ncbi:hypothetical protein ACFU8W_09355 [Streptomyces sp. NPDC057565]|uniref:hypothetical protein n=1 Tax=Streptomyces sp. NPDC057565 TaxID=3346169 RepID=UPI003686EC78
MPHTPAPCGTPGHPPAPAAPGSFRGRAAYGGAEPETLPALDLEPQRQTVYAQVDARFTMEPPKL